MSDRSLATDMLADVDEPRKARLPSAIAITANGVLHEVEGVEAEFVCCVDLIIPHAPQHVLHSSCC